MQAALDDLTGESRAAAALREQLREGKLDDRTVELEVRDRREATVEVITSNNPEELESSNLKDLLVVRIPTKE